jgi:hypothetical protein
VDLTINTDRVLALLKRDASWGGGGWCSAGREKLGIRQKPEILHSDFGSKVPEGGFDPLPRLDGIFIALRRFEVPRPFPRGPY